MQSCPADGSVAKQVRQQQFLIVSTGEGVWPWVHGEDAAIATVAAVDGGNPGIYLITDDQPLQVRAWLPAYAKWLNAPPPPVVSVEAALEVWRLLERMQFTMAPSYAAHRMPRPNAKSVFDRDR